MIEMSGGTGDAWHLGFAGDTLNTLWYARASLDPAEGSVAYFTALGDDGFSDKIDDFRVYARPLSSAEISTLYGNGSGDFGGHPYDTEAPTFDNVPVIKLPNNPIVHWTFDELNGPVAADLSGNALNGSPAGM